jgi:hypothetical protein
MTMATASTEDIRMTRCALDHGGNHTLHRLSRGYVQCAGCGGIHTDESVLSATPGVQGQGGVRRVDASEIRA